MLTSTWISGLKSLIRTTLYNFLFSNLTGKSTTHIEILNTPVHVITDYDAHYNNFIMVEMANHGGFIMHDVLGDSDCMFNAILYQLQYTNIDAPTLAETDMCK